MHAEEIGDLSLEPTADGRHLRLTIAAQQPTTTLSVEGATALWAYLYDWIWRSGATNLRRGATHGP